MAAETGLWRLGAQGRLHYSKYQVVKLGDVLNCLTFTTGTFCLLFICFCFISFLFFYVCCFLCFSLCFVGLCLYGLIDTALDMKTN